MTATFTSLSCQEMEGERTPDVLPAVPTAMPQPPPVPTSHYSRKPRQPQWLVAGIEQREAEEALKNAKSEIDLARATSELAVLAAQLSALRKYRKK